MKPGKYFLARGPVRLGVPRAPLQVKGRCAVHYLCGAVGLLDCALVVRIWRQKGSGGRTEVPQRGLGAEPLVRVSGGETV